MEIFIAVALAVLLIEVTYLVYRGYSPIATSSRKAGRGPVFVDTSVLMDGRILALAESGFIGRDLYVPRSVVGELQFLADNGDADKRMRARAGLDLISELQALPDASVTLFQDGSIARDGVDDRLLELAKKHSGAICTIDFNLNKVATVESIEVLNINELAKQLRATYLPGERISLALTQKGQDPHQAIGHLEDSTMVVVEQASQKIGSTVEVELIRSLQTSAGKMLFARVVDGDKPKSKSSTKKLVTKGRAPMVSKQSTQPSKTQQSKPKGAPTKSSKPRRKNDAEASIIELANRQP